MMVIVLIVTAAISFFVDNLKDTIAILVIVILNAVLGFGGVLYRTSDGRH